MTPPVCVGRFPVNVWANILSRVEFPTLVKAVGQTCQRLNVTMKAEIKARHRELFKTVARDVDRLFGVMREVDAIMGGSAVLQMMCPLFDDVPDYDFFVPLGNHLLLAYYLILVEGYVMEESDEYHAHNGCMVDDITYLSGIGRQVRMTKGDVVVDIMGVGVADAWDRAELPVAGSWTTLLFNYARAGCIVMGYPTLTLEGRGLVQWDRALDASFPDGTRIQELEKYVARGFEFRTQADDWDEDSDGYMRMCRRSWVCPLRPRSFGDAGCLWLDVDGKSARCETTSWILGGSPCPIVCDAARRCSNEVHVDWCNC